MMQSEPDPFPIVRLGQSIKNIGFSLIIIFVGAVLIGFMLAGSITSIARRSTSLGDALLDLRGTLQFYLILLLVLTLITVYVFYRLHRSLRAIRQDSEFGHPLLQRAEKLFLAVVIIEIFQIIIGIYFVNVMLSSLDELARSDPTTTEVERWGNNLNTEGQVVFSSLVGIVITIITLVAFYSIKDWCEIMAAKTRNFWFTEAAQKLGTLAIGLVIVAIGQGFNFLTGGAFGDLISFIGSIITIVAYIQTGNRLQKLPPNTFHKKDSTSPERFTQPAGDFVETSVTELYCNNCGSQMAKGSLFCSSCGVKQAE